MSDKPRDGYDSGDRSSVAVGYPCRFMPDQWLMHGLPPNIDPRRFPFVIGCNNCKACETTLQAMKRHLKVCPNKTSWPDLTCGRCRYSTRSWALMCVHLNKPGMHWEPPCDPKFAPPEIPPCSNQLRLADPPSAALCAAQAITSGSIFSPSIHADTGISLLDLPDVEPDDSEGQTLLPLDRSRSASPAPRDFLRVTSQTVTDPLELADIRASSLGGPSTSPVVVGSQPSLDWSDFLSFGMSPSVLMPADPTAFISDPRRRLPSLPAILRISHARPGDSFSSPRDGRTNGSYFAATSNTSSSTARGIPPYHGTFC